MQITGVTGFVGFRTMVTALKEGYKVRGSIRKESQIAQIKAAKSVQPYLNNLEFAIVPDLHAEGALDKVLDGVKYLLLIASPLAYASDDYEREVLEPVLHGTLSMLESAKKVSSIRRLVITSSVVAIITFPELVVTDERIIHDTDTTPDRHGPFPFGEWEAYSASKGNALNATRKFMETQNPHFDIIHIMPGFIIGRNELWTHRSQVIGSTNENAVKAALGGEFPFPMAGTSVDVDDVALMHVKALNSEVAGNQNFLAHSNGINGVDWDNTLDIISRNFPEQVKSGFFSMNGKAQVKSGFFSMNGKAPTKRLRADATRSEDVLNFKFKGFEDQIRTVVQQYIDLAE
jgi:nucleoside-diphosphate-sugar epimerase